MNNKKMNKKGFTIVELVIVIAVIAILAGVMIPTFGGIIKTANESAVKQAAATLYKEYYAIDMSDGLVDKPVNNGAQYDPDVKAEVDAYNTKNTGKFSVSYAVDADGKITFVYTDTAKDLKATTNDGTNWKVEDATPSANV